MKSNLGMYKIQLGGNNYKQNQEIGHHYQIRRDIGIHHSNAIKEGKPLKVCVFVGEPPSHTFSAIMPLPEGLPEVAFAGALGGRGFRYTRRKGFVISADADFCITGTIIPNETRPEGPFGDHLGYYSLKPLKVEKVYHRDDAIWPFTRVGRPPQEDASFGKLIHEITGPMVEVSIPGVTAFMLLMQPADTLFYLPRARKGIFSEPMGILTHTNAILGFGHCALAKFLIIPGILAIEAPAFKDEVASYNTIQKIVLI